MKRIISCFFCLVFMLSISVEASVNDNIKIEKQLSEFLNYCEPSKVLEVCLTFSGGNATVADMPSWPDLQQARIELSEYYEKRNAEYLSIIFDGIKYQEIFTLHNTIIVGVEAGKIYKIADSDLINYISSYEDTNFESFGEREQFVSEYMLQYSFQNNGSYQEVYYHYNNNGDFDWALVEASYYGPQTSLYYAVFGDKVSLRGQCYPFDICYGVYDAKLRKFFDVCDVYDSGEYADLREKIDSFSFLLPIGDYDMDKKLTILDATGIQKKLAGLTYYNEDDLGDYISLRGELKYVSDIDRDGERTVMDATAIQYKLAGLE